MLDSGKQLESMGHTVFYPESITNLEFKNAMLTTQELRLKHDLITKHFKKIEQSDAILVINLEKNGIKNYIGPNSLMEMAVAFFLNKKIFILNPPPNTTAREEIEAVNPIVLNGKLKIK